MLIPTTQSGPVSLSILSGEVLTNLFVASKSSMQSKSDSSENINEAFTWNTRPINSWFNYFQSSFASRLGFLTYGLFATERQSPAYRLDRPATSLTGPAEIARVVSLLVETPAKRHLGALNQLISKSTRRIPQEIRQPLVARLEQLAEASIEEAESECGQEPITKESLQGCLRFLCSFPVLQLPSLTVTPEGELYAVWKIARDRSFSIRFFSKRFAAYVLFVRDNYDESRIARHTGVVSLEGLTDVIAQHRVDRWLVHSA
jgi:hypothetical protein